MDESAPDFVYICRPGKNEELRFSLRSLVNVPHRNVWVVGGKPSWYEGRWIRVAPRANKYEHNRANLRAIVESEKISDDFVLMNDDFFIVRPIERVPVLHLGRLEVLVDALSVSAPDARFTKMLATTLVTLRVRGVADPLSYNTHTPMPMRRSELGRVLGLEGSPRSLVGNLFGYGGEFSEDVKVHQNEASPMRSYEWRTGSSPFLSTNDHTFRRVWQMTLRNMFRERSPWET